MVLTYDYRTDVKFVVTFTINQGPVTSKHVMIFFLQLFLVSVNSMNIHVDYGNIR